MQKTSGNVFLERFFHIFRFFKDWTQSWGAPLLPPTPTIPFRICGPCYNIYFKPSEHLIWSSFILNVTGLLDTTWKDIAQFIPSGILMFRGS